MNRNLSAGDYRMKTAHHLYTDVYCPLTLSSFEGHRRLMNNDPEASPGSHKHRKVTNVKSRLLNIVPAMWIMDLGQSHFPFTTSHSPVRLCCGKQT